MIGFATRRLLQAMIVMLVVAFACLLTMFRFVGDPVNQMVGIETSIEEREALRERLGLNDPIAVQFLRFVDKSRSVLISVRPTSFRQPVSDLFAKRIPATLELSFHASALFALVVGIPMGDLCGLE